MGRNEIGNMHTREIGQLLVREIVDCGKVGRFVLVCLMAEMLKHFFEIHFNFVECFDGITSARDINN